MSVSGNNLANLRSCRQELASRKGMIGWEKLVEVQRTNRLPISWAALAMPVVSKTDEALSRLRHKQSVAHTTRDVRNWPQEMRVRA